MKKRCSHISKFLHKIIRRYVRWIFRIKCRVLSDDTISIKNNSLFNPYRQNAVYKGCGSVIFRGSACFGSPTSAGYLTSYAYIEARNKDTIVIINDNFFANNGFAIIAEGGKAGGVSIGNDCLIGSNVLIVDSDFHNIAPSSRNDKSAKMAQVTIGNNVFIGSRSLILKGVTIGDNAVIGAGSVVTKSIPANCVAAGNL